MGKHRSKEERMEEAAAYFVQGYKYDDIPRMMGITPRTLRNYMADPDWEAVVEAQQEPLVESTKAKALQVIIEAIESGDVPSAKWFLERTARTFSSDAKTRREAYADRIGVKLFDEEASVEAELEDLEEEDIEALALRWKEKN